MESYNRSSDGVYIPLIDLNLSPSAALTADVNGSAVELGGPRGVVLTLDVTAVSASDTLDVKIQGSPNNSDWYDIVSFTQATDVTTERKHFVGDRYIRAVYDVTGTDVSITCTLTGEAEGK